MRFKNKRAANWLGFVSLSLSIVPLTYIAYPDVYPDTSLTEAVVLFGGPSGSFLVALAAGFLGSKWWFVAGLASVLDVVCIFGFSP
jgi:hypothetical protein